jgi:hypothetical protein
LVRDVVIGRADDHHGLWVPLSDVERGQRYARGGVPWAWLDHKLTLCQLRAHLKELVAVLGARDDQLST